MTTKRMMSCQIAKKKCLPSLFPILELLQNLSRSFSGKKKNDQQCAAMLSALLSIFESPISSHPPSQRVCVSDETFGENLTKHTMKVNELDPTMQRDPV